MKTENKVLMTQARQVLSGKWLLAIQGTVVYLLVAILLTSVLGKIFTAVFVATPNLGKLLKILVAIGITGPMALGAIYFYLPFSRNQITKISNLFKSYENFKRFRTAYNTYFLVNLYTFLWTLLLVVPGVIALLSYSQTFFIIAEDDSIGSNDAIAKSKKMMQGYKWKYFCLGFRFFGWALLCGITFGIGFLWLFPYIQISLAKFYDDVKVIPVEASTTQV